MIFFYVFITYGKKPSGTPRNHAEARTQLDALDRIRAQHPDKEVKVISEYCRSVRHLNNLPKFNGMLSVLESAGIGLFFIDDLHRIFRRSPPDARESCLSEMRAYEGYIFSLRHKRKLSEFSEEQIALLLHYTEQVKIPRSRVGASNTEKARIASSRSRTDRSIEIGLEIRKLQAELLDTNDAITLQMVADLANERGMKTATGKQWTRQTIGKALEAAQRSETE